MRRALSPRRPGLTTNTIWRGKHQVAVTVNCDPDTGHPAELFLRGLKEDTELGETAADVGILISIALRNGEPLDQLAKTLGADGPDPSLAALACKQALATVQGQGTAL